MSDSDQLAGAEGADVCVARRDHELRARFERLRALNSAWAVLAPFDLAAQAGHIVETGRAVRQDLSQLAARDFENRDRAALPKLDKLLGAIESEIRTLAFDVPVALLRSALPARISSERRGVLDLLDLMLVSEIEGEDGAAGRLSALDYLITLLCTNADGAVLDPIGLTPRLHTLCERAGEQDDPRFDAFEAEFYAAADVTEEDARDEDQLRALRRRKRELGASFFAPRLLRAIVSYNTSLSRCIARGVFDSRDWGSLPNVEEQAGAETSVFETEVLPRLGEALRRRADGRAPSTSAIDRIAWCLDLASLDESARAALLAPTVGTAGDLEGTAILIGLLCRSANVLDGELPAIGISPDTLSSVWLREMDAALKRGVNERIAGDAYDEACALSELRTTFLYSLVTDEHRGQRRVIRRVPDAPRFQQVEREARQIAGEAIERSTTEREPVTREDWKLPRSWPWATIGRLAGAGAAAGLGIAALAFLFFGGEIDSLRGADLDRVSPYLVDGGRNGDGTGSAFVGTIGDDWIGLSADLKERAAAKLVRALRAQGVREIMIYDEDRRLRIQALGERPVRILPASGP